MNDSVARFLPAAALAVAVLGTSRPAHAVSKVFAPGASGNAYCVELNANINGLTADGEHLNITASAGASAWTSGTCDGASAPKGYFEFSPELLFSPNGLPPYQVVYVDDELNDYDLWGTWLAVVGEDPPFTGIDLPASWLKGPGYYMLEVGADANVGVGDGQNVVKTPWTYVDVPYSFLK